MYKRQGLTDYTKIPEYSEFEMASYKHSEVEWLYNAWIEIPWGYIPSDDLMSKYSAGDRRLDLWFPWGTCNKKVTMEWVAPVNAVSYTHLRGEAKGNDMTMFTATSNTTVNFGDRLMVNLLLKGSVRDVKGFAYGVDPFAYAYNCLLYTSRCV